MSRSLTRLAVHDAHFVYTCPYCKSTYDNFTDARECRNAEQKELTMAKPFDTIKSTA